MQEPVQEPDWATFERDPRAWLGLLRHYQIDETAQQSVFLLAQFSDEGHREANNVLYKLFKKMGEGSLTNPSKFVHKCVTNARQALEQQYHAGQWRR